MARVAAEQEQRRHQRGPSGQSPEQIDWYFTNQSHSPARTAQSIAIAVPGGAIPPSVSFALLFGSDVNGAVQIEADAQGADGTIASAITSTTVQTYHATTASLQLTGVTSGDMGMSDLMAVPDLLDCTQHATAQFVISSVGVPAQRSAYALDLNGDGNPDNQYGAILASMSGNNLTTAGTDIQGAINGGTQLMLVAESSTSTSFASDLCAQAAYQMAQPHASPKFDGTDVFVVDTTVPGGRISGTIGPSPTPAAGADMGAPMYPSAFFNSASPATADAASQVSITVPLAFGAGAIVRVPLWGAHAQFEKSGATLVAGQLNGAIKSTDVAGIVYPALAAAYTSVAQRMPCDATCTQLQQIFDSGGTADPACAAGTCRNPDGSCAAKGDQVISVCEVSTNAVIESVFAPDVAMFDPAGNYHPDPTNAMKNAVSVGFSFVAETASY